MFTATESGDQLVINSEISPPTSIPIKPFNEIKVMQDNTNWTAVHSRRRNLIYPLRSVFALGCLRTQDRKPRGKRVPSGWMWIARLCCGLKVNRGICNVQPNCLLVYRMSHSQIRPLCQPYSYLASQPLFPLLAPDTNRPYSLRILFCTPNQLPFTASRWMTWPYHIH